MQTCANVHPAPAQPACFPPPPPAPQDECEADLAEAIPILNEALSALDTIKEADINYIKKLGNPPAAIKLVMEAVCVVLDVKPGKMKDESGAPPFLAV